MTARPIRVRLRAYNVGFGDCLLLTVVYSEPLADGRAERHMLVDMGTKAATDDGPSLSDIAPLIGARAEDAREEGGLDLPQREG